MMRPFKSTISLTDALSIVEEAATPIARTERVPLDAAAGRVLAAEIVASRDVPPFDRAVMDGYAVRSADTAGASQGSPAILACVDVLFAGHVGERGIGAAECAEIATGAPVPPGADAVVMVEATSRSSDGRQISLFSEARRGQNIGPKASDIAAGETVLLSGSLLSPARVGALAALGHTSVSVFERPRVFVASSGDEVVAPGEPLETGQIYDVNRFTLPAVIRQHGGEPVMHAIVRDTMDDLRRALVAASGAELVVISGGSSVGERDLMIDAVRERGDVLFHGIAVKPGKPTMLARLGSQLLLGMPGNPTSCLSNAYVVLVPLLRRMARLPAHVPDTRTLPLARAIAVAPGRHQFYSVRVEQGAAVPAFKGSGDITSLAGADGYIEIPANVERIEAGTMVQVRLY
jgi:molybdenum cofactor synthesis domain-containing protein